MSSQDESCQRELDALLQLDESSGPAVRSSAEQAEAMVAAAVARAYSASRVAAIPKNVRWLLAAAVLAIAGGAVALVVTRSVRRESAQPAPVAPAPSAVAPQPAPPRPAGKPAEPPSEPEPAAEETPEAAASGSKAMTPAKRAQVATDLLKTANQLRGQGRWRAAESAYSQVLRTNPGSRQAYVATLAAAALRLEHLRDPAGALRLYQSVLRGGALGEEAQFGVARCHRALGNTAAEAQALRRFIASRPSSLLRKQAQKRLEQIESPRR